MRHPAAQTKELENVINSHQARVSTAALVEAEVDPEDAEA